jgi:hypothetical protein
VAAARAGAVLITIDKDFGELAVVRGQHHAGIMRIVGFPAREQGPACVAALARYEGELAGALVTVERTRVCVRSRREDPRRSIERGGGALGIGGVTFVADLRSNSFRIRARPADVQRTTATEEGRRADPEPARRDRGQQ